jgi:hypothetical protein
MQDDGVGGVIVKRRLGHWFNLLLEFTLHGVESTESLRCQRREFRA